MCDPRGDLVIVFNGEIYNFRTLRRELEALGHAFRSNSDTEIILGAYREWGERCVDRLDGMFAFALYDVSNRRVFIARDRAGEKPLFYSVTQGTLRFASELKALMADPSFQRRLSPEAVDCYLGLGFVPGDLCILQGVHKLPPAHSLTFCLGDTDVRVRRYWRPPDYSGAPTERVDERELLIELESLLESSVARQLVADVQVGVLLSGGVDSSLVTAMAVRATRQVKTFTVRFPGYGTYDETDHARLIARHFGTEHIELTAPESTVDLLPRLATQFDEPMIDSSMIPTFLVSQLVREHCTVALGGDGGDELFGGYPHYSRLLRLQDWTRRVPQAVLSFVGTVALRTLPIGFRGRNWLSGLTEDLQSELPNIAMVFDRLSRRRLMKDPEYLPYTADAIRAERVPASSDLLQRATRSDFENYLAEDILVKVDRAGMLNSLEIRAPILDRSVMEFAFGKVPSQLKATTKRRKILLKKLGERVLPAEFDHSRKQGFSIPLSSWLKQGPWHDHVNNVLLNSGDSLFDPNFVRHLVRGQGRGRANGERLFGLTLFELWRKTYNVSIG
jgi:asparagine synthase (glutamine-hydrolysing)